jgi:hypothetical protein
VGRADIAPSIREKLMPKKVAPLAAVSNDIDEDEGPESEDAAEA